MTEEKTPKLRDVLKSKKNREISPDAEKSEENPTTENSQEVCISNKKSEEESYSSEEYVDDYFQYNDVITSFIKYLDKSKRTKEEIKEYILNNFLPFSGKSVRHSYFQISATLQGIRGTEASDGSILMYNLELLINEVINDKEVHDIKDKLFKFYDHCQLEIGRFNYFDSIFWKDKDANLKYESINEKINKTKNELSDAKKQIDSLNEVIESSKSELDKVIVNTNDLKKDIESSKSELNKVINNTNDLKKVIESSKSEHITILSIFAAIVLASLGGLSFLSSVLKGINEASIFRLVMISSICGFVLFNTLFMLLYMTSRIIGRSIYTFCSEAEEGTDCTIEHKKCPKNCCGITRVRKRLPYVFWVNIMFLIFMILDVFAWIVLRTKVFEPVPIFLICIKESIVSLLF